MPQAQGPVRVALIGSGRMGAFHGETLARRLPGAVLAAVADPAPGAAERIASELGAPKFFTDPAAAFADPEIDAVVIAAPARFYADLVVAAAAAGKGVFCEKPMAVTLADADRAIDAASRRSGSTGGSPRTGPRPGHCSTTAGWVPRGCCGRSPAIPAVSTRHGSRRTPSSWRP